MATNHANGILFDGLHSYADFGMWLALRPDYGNPVPKTNTAEVPGMDGVLDMTEANSGEIKYTNRTLKFTFAKKIDAADQEDFKAHVRAALHGKYIKKIIPDDASDWYYSGRATVTFEKLSSWRLRCVVTVDAAPYALRVDETVVDLTAADEAEENIIEIPATRVGTLDFNTDLRLGTKAFPDGLIAPETAMTPLYLASTENPPKLDTWYLNITDSDGNVYSSGRAAWPPAPGLYEVPFDLSAVSEAGVDLAKVYRVLTPGLGDVRIYWKMLSKRYIVDNSRKNVIPVIALETQEPSIEITVNGKSHTIYPGTAAYENIILGEGENVINVPLYQMETLTMTFREGRL